MSNLRQISMALLSYAQDNDGYGTYVTSAYDSNLNARMIDGYLWEKPAPVAPGKSVTYKRKVLACPGKTWRYSMNTWGDLQKHPGYETDTRNSSNNNTVWSSYYILFGWDLNPELRGATSYYVGGRRIRLNAKTNPTHNLSTLGRSVETFWMNDPENRNYTQYRSPSLTIMAGDQVSGTGYLQDDKKRPGPHARMGGSTVFFDGHVQWITRQQMRDSYNAAKYWGSLWNNRNCGGLAWIE